MLPVREADRRYAPRARHERPHHVLLPGLVNAHTHAAMTLFRGFADDLPFETWLRERIWPAEARWVGPELVADGTRLAIAEMLAGRHHVLLRHVLLPRRRRATVAAEAGMRAVLGMIALDFPTAWAKNADEYLRKGLEVHDRFKAEPLITTAFAPHAPYSRRRRDARRTFAGSPTSSTCPIHMHVHETAAEVAEARRGDGPAAARAARGARARDAEPDRRARDAARRRRDRPAGDAPARTSCTARART